MAVGDGRSGNVLSGGSCGPLSSILARFLRYASRQLYLTMVAARNRCHLIGPDPRQSPSRSRRGTGLFGLLFMLSPRASRCDRATAAQASSATATSRSRHRRAAAAAAAAAASSRRRLASACDRHVRHAAERPCARQLRIARSALLQATARARAVARQCAKAPPRVRRRHRSKADARSCSALARASLRVTHARHARPMTHCLQWRIMTLALEALRSRAAWALCTRAASPRRHTRHRILSHASHAARLRDHEHQRLKAPSSRLRL